MFNMMSTTGLGFSTLWALHVLSVIAFFTGVIFFIAFAIKTFKPALLKNWAIWLIIIGAVVCLFTIAVMGHPWVGMGYFMVPGTGPGMMQGIRQ